MRRTYGLLGVSLIAFAAITGGMMRYATETSLRMTNWMAHGRGSMMIVLVLFLLSGYVAQRLARSDTSRGLQCLGLGISIASYSILLQPILWELIYRFGRPGMIRVNAEGILAGHAASILMQAIVITLAIFVGLTATVFVTKKDFSFMRGALAIGTFAAMGVILASWLFGFSLGALFCGLVVLLMGGYILYKTSVVMSYFPPTGYVSAALMLFSTVATLFFYVLRILTELNRR